MPVDARLWRDETQGYPVTGTVVVPARAFQHWDDATHAWHIEPGTFHLHVGPSSANHPR